MPMPNSANMAEIHMPNRVTFSDRSEFRKKLYGYLEANFSHISINLSSTDFMDSSGLGMLLVALKECQSRNVALTLVGPHGDVKKLLDLTHSAERFRIVS